MATILLTNTYISKNLHLNLQAVISGMGIRKPRAGGINQNYIGVNVTTVVYYRLQDRLPSQQSPRFYTRDSLGIALPNKAKLCER